MLFIIILAALLSFARPMMIGDVQCGKTQEPPERLPSSYGSVKGLLKPRQQNSAYNWQRLVPESKSLPMNGFNILAVIKLQSVI